MATTGPQTTIAVFETDISPATAAEILIKTDEKMVDATADSLVYYPYHVFGFDLHAEALLDEFDDRIYCGIDLCNDKEVFIDEVPNTMEQVVDEEAIVPPETGIRDPEQTARAYLMELARKELRVGSPPDLTVVENRRIHRPFHVVTCETTTEQRLTYIVDAVTGDFHRVYLD
ncbi:hypothetical protein [Natronorubrum aibiense]|uniref:PepSY domain-containing protein n=1 Tax=Natronorubrum aibiense TaxID=348826 RepID=A0A5P9P986_9EURY|nr:hypothetical protein [Natronorubrum aibiense]QFU84557.1 hypothetical protein GCU68_18735 [Natronorubrum aibiense]